MKVECTYCGQTVDREEVQEHHVIPQALFEKKKYADQYRTLACEKCHDKLSEEFIQDKIVRLPSGKKLKVIEDG